MLWKAWTDRGSVYSAKGRILSNMLYMRYVHLTKAKPIHKRILASERMLHKDYGRKGSVAHPCPPKNAVHEPHGTWHQDELIGGKLPVVK
jgi:hypothetical protein